MITKAELEHELAILREVLAQFNITEEKSAPLMYGVKYNGVNGVIWGTRLDPDRRWVKRYGR